MKTKRLLSAILMAATLLSASAQVPEGIRFQTVVRDANGNVIAEKPVGIRLTIMKKSGTTSTELYAETFEANTDAIGTASVVFGEGTVVSGKVATSFEKIDWSTADGDRWMKVEVDPNGGTNYTVISGESQLLSAPYAMMAKKVDQVGSLKFASVDASIKVTGSAKPTQFPEITFAGTPVTPSATQNVEVLAYTPTYLTIKYPSSGFSGFYVADVLVNGKSIKPNIKEIGFNRIELPVVKNKDNNAFSVYYTTPHILRNGVLTEDDGFGPIGENDDYVRPSPTISTKNTYEWSIGKGQTKDADIVVGPFINGKTNTVEVIITQEIN